MAKANITAKTPTPAPSPIATSVPATTSGATPVSAPPPVTEQVTEKETKVGEVLSVGVTSGADKYIVRVESPEGYKQTMMSGDEVRAAGGIVPTRGKKYIQRYAGSDVYGKKSGKAPSTVYKFAQDLVSEQGLKPEEARRITELAMREPDAPDWLPYQIMLRSG